MAKYRVHVPLVDDMGSVSPFTVVDNLFETHRQQALWHLNRMRDRDGLPHLSRMPAGTRYKRIKDGK